MILALIAVLALVGIYVSGSMLSKQLRGARGELTEPSVVMTSRAKVTGVPNALIGLIFYLALLVATPFLPNHLVWIAAFAAASLAAGLSCFLAYSLLFITRMPCAYCWTGHIINWLLLPVLLLVR
jgi:uncharacterized membrane protein